MNEELTGRTRLRVHTQRGKEPVLVLQVERTWADAPSSWRDARVEDFLLTPQTFKETS